MTGLERDRWHDYFKKIMLELAPNCEHPHAITQGIWDFLDREFQGWITDGSNEENAIERIKFWAKRRGAE